MCEAQLADSDRHEILNSFAMKSTLKGVINFMALKPLKFSVPRPFYG